MNELLSHLDDFTVGNFKDISDAVVKFDEYNIDNEMFRQASVYSYYYGLMGAAKKRMNDLDTELVRLVHASSGLQSWIYHQAHGQGSRRSSLRGQQLPTGSVAS